MIEQVQLDDGQILKAMAEHRNTSEIIMILKGYVIGYLGIPLNHHKMSELLGMIDLYHDWIQMGTLSPKNLIDLFLGPLKSIKSFHNRPSSTQDQTHCIEVIQNKVQGLVQRVMQDENYFYHTPAIYNPKQAILMSLNMTQNQCTICSVNMDPEQVIILDCTHVYHFECLHQHVKNTIQNGQVIVKCPNQYCGIELQHQELFNFMTPELQKKYQDFMMNQYVEKNGGNTSWCPTPDCNLMFEFDPQVTDFYCRNCRKRYCLKCRCDFHENMTCQQNQEFRGMSSEDQSFVTFARGAKFKQCPRCKFWVEKSIGCVSMKCRCNQDFCYECGGVTCPHGRCSKNNAFQRPNAFNTFSNRRM